VTLNITVLTENHIFQSSDFRRMSTTTGLIDLPAMKLITLQYPTFDGLACYTGLAKERITDPKDTADHILGWLRQTGEMRFFQIVEHLRSQASAYIRDIEQRTGIRECLTIVAAAFVASQARVAVISNFEDTQGYKPNSPFAQLETSWEAYRHGNPPIILVTGNKAAVTSEQRKALTAAVIDAGEDAGRIRNEIQFLSRAVARSRAAIGDKTITEECTVASLNRSGGGYQSIEPGPMPGLSTHHVLNGVLIDEALSSIGFRTATTVQAAFGTSKPTTRSTVACERRDPVACERVVSDSAESGYTMTEIMHFVDAECTPLGISSDRMVFGWHRSPETRGYRRYWRWSEKSGPSYIDVAPTLDASGCMNASGDIALVSGEREQPNVLTLAIGAPGFRSLEVPSGMGEPLVTAMNEAGRVCGAIAINQDNTDASRQRPVFWDEDGSLHIAEDLRGGTHGRAVHINNAGQVLVWSSRGAWHRICVIWDAAKGTTVDIPGNIIPNFLTRDGKVLGFDRRGGRDAAIVSYDQATWTRLPLNDGFMPTICDNSLNIGGRVKIDGYDTGWVLVNKRQPRLLPTYEYHHAYLRAVNDSGVIVGQLSGRDQHVMLWVPPQLA